jgi:hypothetical protein
MMARLFGPRTWKRSPGRGPFALNALLPSREDAAAKTPLGIGLTDIKTDLGRPLHG